MGMGPALPSSATNSRFTGTVQSNCSRDQNAEAGRSSGPRITELSGAGGVAARASATRSLSCAPMVVTTWAPASYRRTPPFTTSRAAGTTRALTTGSSSGAVRTSPSPIKLVETTEPRVTSSKRAITHLSFHEWSPSLPQPSPTPAHAATWLSNEGIYDSLMIPAHRLPYQGRPPAGSTPVTASTRLGDHSMGMCSLRGGSGGSNWMSKYSVMRRAPLRISDWTCNTDAVSPRSPGHSGIHAAKLVYHAQTSST